VLPAVSVGVPVWFNVTVGAALPLAACTTTVTGAEVV